MRETKLKRPAAEGASCWLADALLQIVCSSYRTYSLAHGQQMHRSRMCARTIECVLLRMASMTACFPPPPLLHLSTTHPIPSTSMPSQHPTHCITREHIAALSLPGHPCAPCRTLSLHRQPLVHRHARVLAGRACGWRHAQGAGRSCEQRGWLPDSARMCSLPIACVLFLWHVFSSYRMRSLPLKCVLFLYHVFSSYTMCSLPIACVLFLWNVFSSSGMCSLADLS